MDRTPNDRPGGLDHPVRGNLNWEDALIDRRNLLAAGAIAPVLIPSLFPGSAHAAATASSGKTFILVHGSWHSSGHWQRLAALLSAAGHAVIAPDLPGHGLSAEFPKSYFERPIDLARFSEEPSPLARITLDQYVATVGESVRLAARAGRGPIVLVGHSMGGVTITAVAEEHAKEIDHLVYLAAFMPDNGASALTYLGAPEAAGGAFGPLLLGDPSQTGCVRIDTRSADPKYIAALKFALYNDADDQTFQAAANLLTPDDPIGHFAAPAVRTRANWGAVPRSYIRTLRDNALPLALQDRFLRETAAFAPSAPTHVYDLDSGHSPFLSVPQTLADILLKIASV
jgi:pimeloyl-ACP methyl ester carboxylesterase